MVKLNNSSLSLAEHFGKYQAKKVQNIYLVPDMENRNKHINIKIALEHDYTLGFYYKPSTDPWQKVTLDLLEKIISDKYSLDFNSNNFVYQFKPTEDFIKNGETFYLCICEFLNSPCFADERIRLGRDLKKKLKALVKTYSREKFYHNLHEFFNIPYNWKKNYDTYIK